MGFFMEIIVSSLQGKTLRCSLSETKNRLFIGNIPKSLTENEFRKVIEEVGPGVEIIELIKVCIYFKIILLYAHNKLWQILPS